MTSIEGSSDEIVDDHAPLWKYVINVKKLERKKEIGDESVVIALKHSMDHTQKSRPISCE